MSNGKQNLVPGVGLEPTRITPADFKSAASANSATPAKAKFYEIAATLGNFGVKKALFF
jgi:hypothetical protein